MHIDLMAIKKILVLLRYFQHSQHTSSETDIHFSLFFARVVQLDYVPFTVDFMVSLAESIMNDPHFFEVVQQYK